MPDPPTTAFWCEAHDLGHDRHHAEYLELLETHPGPPIVPTLEPVTAADWTRIAELVGRYRDSRSARSTRP